MKQFSVYVILQSRAVSDGSGLTEVQKQIFTGRCMKNLKFAQLVGSVKAHDSNEFLAELYEVINQATNVINESQCDSGPKVSIRFRL